MKNDSEFWKRKLIAFLHDPPCKCFDIARHKLIADSFARAAGLSSDDLQSWHLEQKQQDNFADHFAAAADRFPFPGRASGLRSRFEGKKLSPFKHPLGGTELSFDHPIPSVELAEEIFQDIQKGISTEDIPPDYQSWANFFLHWRRWPIEAAKKDERLAFLPAETRMPDHTIWNHMSLTSALSVCTDETGKMRPAFLLFQLGPVQDFIAQARSARDLWSGSFLLSWLAVNAIKAITDRLGPDNIIYPSLRGQPLFDALHRKDLFDRITYPGKGGKSEPLWNRMSAELDNEQLVTPTIPNRFLAIVPATAGTELAAKAEAAVSETLNEIGSDCWNWVENTAIRLSGTDRATLDKWKRRWDGQVSRFPEVTWQVTTWPDSIDEAMGLSAQLPVNKKSIRSANDKGSISPFESLDALKKLACEIIPAGHRDKRFYSDAEKTQLSNPAFAWSAHYALTDFAHAARRNTRDFSQWDTDTGQHPRIGDDGSVHGVPKDSLSGKEEIIGGEDFWKEVTEDENLKTLFKPDKHRLGAMNLIKRLWCRPEMPEINYLADSLGLNEPKFKEAVRIDSVGKIADPKFRDDDENARPDCPYVAVIAMDGDEIGKWLSGEKTPLFRDQLSEEAREYFAGILDQRNSVNDDKYSDILENVKRPLSPAYHLQFSEALSNFSCHIAGKAVAACEGQLIYAGGDDVLAMVPARQAFRCVQLLRALFRGSFDDLRKLDDLNNSFEIVDDGFVKLKYRDVNNKECMGHPILVPGPQMEVSCGITIAHYKTPLQAMVRAAQVAEKRAKNEYSRNAFAVTLLKHSGETIIWGGKWESKLPDKTKFRVLDLYQHYCKLREKPEALSSRFPYALAGFLRPYFPDTNQSSSNNDFPAREIILQEFEHVMKQQNQGGNTWLGSEEANQLKKLAGDYLTHLDCRSRKNGTVDLSVFEEFEKLFLTAAFLQRTGKI